MHKSTKGHSNLPTHTLLEYDIFLKPTTPPNTMNSFSATLTAAGPLVFLYSSYSFFTGFTVYQHRSWYKGDFFVRVFNDNVVVPE